MAAETRREAAPLCGDPADPGMGDPRDYLYLELESHRRSGDRTGLAVAVRLDGDHRVRSDHGMADRAMRRNGPVSTAIKLPPGTRPSAPGLAVIRVDDPR